MFMAGRGEGRRSDPRQSAAAPRHGAGHRRARLGDRPTLSAGSKAVRAVEFGRREPFVTRVREVRFRRAAGRAAIHSYEIALPPVAQGRPSGDDVDHHEIHQ